MLQRAWKLELAINSAMDAANRVILPAATAFNVFSALTLYSWGYY